MLSRIFLPSLFLFCAFHNLAIATSLDYECVFDKGGPIVDPANPYQVEPTELSNRFLERHSEDHFSSEGKTLVLGDYTVDRGVRLGYGDEGSVYLGRHDPSGIYVAAKIIRTSRSNTEEIREYGALTHLGQLYSCWKEKGGQFVYFLIPFVDGSEISSFQYGNSWIEADLQGTQLVFEEGLSQAIKLVRSLLNQVHYVAEHEVVHDWSGCNFMVTSDLQEVVLIDFDGLFHESHCPMTPSRYDVHRSTFYCSYLLGTRPYLERLQNGEITSTSPGYVMDFLRVMKSCSKKRKPVYLSDFQNAVESLESAALLNLENQGE